MKRHIFAMSLLGALTLTACGGGSTGLPTTNPTTSDNITNPIDNDTRPDDTSGDNSTGDQDSDPTSGSGGSDDSQSGDGTEDESRFGEPGAEPAPAGEAPVANDDSYDASSNEALAIGPNAGVMDNDTVASDASAEVFIKTQPNHGAVALQTDGAFNYTPDHNFEGVDEFEYTLTDTNGGEASAKVTVTVASAESKDKGFTPIIASDDTRTVYVSSSEGLDTNDGLRIDAPVKTLKQAFSLTRSGYPDHVLLKRGDVWKDERLDDVKSGRSKSEPMVVAFYGDTGDRPKLKTSGNTISTYALDYVNFMGLEIEAYKMNPADPGFDGQTSANVRMIGEFKNILWEDIKFRFVEFVVQGYDGKAPRDFHIRRCMILDKYSPNTSFSRDSRPSGIYTDNGDGLTIEESLWDHNGWSSEVGGAGANMYNHNMYISERNNVGNKVVIRNNIVTRASSHGVHGRPGGLYENNFFGRNAISLQMGYHGGPELSSGTFAYARDNVITEGVNMNRGIDSCSNSSLCTHAIWGIEVDNLGGADVRVERNIVSNRQWDYGYVSGIRQQDTAKYTDNIIYKWDSETQGTDKGYPDPGRTLADYNASLGGERSFEAFIDKARSRGLQEWDERYTADAINDYIRAGFGR